MIEQDLNVIRRIVSTMVRNQIVGTAEFRLPGNGQLGNQVKVDSESYLKKRVEDQTDRKAPGVEVDDVTKYFRTLLSRKIKGNFVVEVLPGGIIADRVTNAMLTGTDAPVVLGNNTIISIKEGGKP